MLDIDIDINIKEVSVVRPWTHKDAVLDLMDEKPYGVELVLTGRRCPDAIMDRADLVIEMKAIKHYYDEGVIARVGLEN